MEPSACVRRMISPNCSGETSRPGGMMSQVTATSGDMGSSPMRPAANWAFWLVTAFATSSGVISSCCIFCGSSQRRMA